MRENERDIDSADRAVCVVALGSNLGQRLGYFKAALKGIETEIGQIASVSSVYETRPWGEVDVPALGQANYLNAIAEIHSSLEPNALLRILSRIEARLGRVRGIARQVPLPRTLDLDLIAVEQRVVNSKALCLPHPRLHRRDFVLMPFVEVLPSWQHPLLGVSADELLSNLRSAEGFEPTVVSVNSDWI